MQALDSMGVSGFPLVGVLHIGANEGQERLEYAASGANPCIYVEPVNEVFGRLLKNIEGMPGHIAVKAVCSDIVGDEIEFNIANNGGLSSSMLRLGAHERYHPSIYYTSTQKMKTTTVDALLDSMHLDSLPNLMVIDTQGAELKVLKGSTATLQFMDGIYAEVSETPLYEGGCTQDEITEYLRRFGFRLRWITLDALGQGDAIYCRRFDFGEALPSYNGNIALGRPAEQSSVSPWSTPNDAAGAVNGFKTGSFSFHTFFETSPWWQVDLGEVRPISEIRVYNRILVARERARSLQIFLSNDKERWRKIHDQKNKIFGGVDGRPLRVSGAGNLARYVRLRLNDDTALHLDEVEIY